MEKELDHGPHSGNEPVFDDSEDKEFVYQVSTIKACESDLYGLESR